MTRKDWGANESLRDGDPTYNHTLKQVHIHHTVNANDYSRRDVPALIRGMYAYHTQTLDGPTSATTSSWTDSGVPSSAAPAVPAGSSVGLTLWLQRRVHRRVGDRQLRDRTTD